MRELGRRGGLVRPSTRLRESADDDLREQARGTLSRALAGEDVPKPALDAARSLFAYRPAEVPRGQEREPQHRDRGVFNLSALVRVAIETGVLEVSGEGELVVGGEPVELTHTPSPEKIAQREALPPAPAHQEVHSETPEDDGRLGRAL